ncbi:MAG: fatty acid desaturase [Lutibacter sp.]
MTNYLINEEEIIKKLQNWRKIISKYKTKNNRKAVFQILTSILPFIAIWILMYFTLSSSILLFIFLSIINALFLIRIFIIQHDCGHHSFLKSRNANNIVGYICSIFSFLPYKYWAKTHTFHHGHTGMLEYRAIGDLPTLTVNEFKKANKWNKLKYRIFRMPFVTFIIAPIYYLFITTKFPFLKFNNKKKTAFMLLIDNLVIIFPYIMLGFIVGWKYFLLTQFLILFFFGIVAFWFFYIQHQHESSYKQWKKNWNFLLSAIKGSSFYKLPKIFQWFTGNIGIHHIHHLNSLIPNYNLKKCLNENPILTKYTTIVTFKESLKMISNKLWDENQQKMISFSEYRKLYGA